MENPPGASLVNKPLRIVWDLAADPIENARTRLPAMARDYFARARALLAKDVRPDQFHPLRLATKRFRYTLELFRHCYGPGLKERLEALRELQNFLGDINDAVATGRIAATLLPAESPDRKRFEEALHKLAAEKTEGFRKHWTEVFDAPGQEEWWTDYLTRQARKRK